MISTICPVVPPSSPARIVPQGVRCSGSPDVNPVRIVSTEPSDRRMRWTPGKVVPCSFTTIR